MFSNKTAAAYVRFSAFWGAHFLVLFSPPKMFYLVKALSLLAQAFCSHNSIYAVPSTARVGVQQTQDKRKTHLE